MPREIYSNEAREILNQRERNQEGFLSKGEEKTINMIRDRFEKKSGRKIIDKHFNKLKYALEHVRHDDVSQDAMEDLEEHESGLKPTQKQHLRNYNLKRIALLLGIKNPEKIDMDDLFRMVYSKLQATRADHSSSRPMMASAAPFVPGSARSRIAAQIAARYSSSIIHSPPHL